MKSLLAALGMMLLLLPGSAMSQSAEVLTNDDLKAGEVPAVGDTVILKDFANCYPRSAIRQESVKGKWWLRPYRTEGGTAGAMLCVEERDMDDPQSCIAPELKYHVNLEGIYDIWVGTYRPIMGGGIDIKLTRDKMYTCIDPWETGLDQWPPRDEQIGRLVEYFWKTDDLTGQNIELRQPHGTYGSFWWGLCNAHVAYIKLIRRSPEQVERQAAERAKLWRKGVVVNRDGFSWIWMWGIEGLDCILQQVEKMQYGNVEALDFCIGGSATPNFVHPMTTGRTGIPGGGRLGDKRARRIFQHFYDNGIDILQILTERCHEMGVKIYASQRVNARYGPSDVWSQHPEWRLDSGAGWDFAIPEVRAYCRDYLLYVAENYDIDGITTDFSRGKRRHVNPDEENPLVHMNAWMRELRAGLDRIGTHKGKRLMLNASFVCHTRYEGASPEQQGLDVQTWVDEGIVDCIMPYGRDSMKYLEMCLGKPTKCYLRTSRGLDFAGQALGAHHHDPTAQEDKTDRPVIQKWCPLDYIGELLSWYDAGADGVLQFNKSDAWVTYRNLPYPDTLRQEVATGQPFGMREGEKVQWLQ